MTTFTDITGEKWDINLTIAAARRLAAIGVKFDNILNPNPQEPNILDRLAGDSLLLFEVIYTLCESQVKERQLSSDQFAERFDGTTVEAAGEALLDEIVNFSRPAQKKILIHLRRISKQKEQEALKEIDSLLESPDAGERLMNLSMNAQGSSELSPTN